MLTASFRPPSGGWYVRPPVQQRGRSRQVSAAAKARVASEQRRARLYDQQSLQCHPISVSDPSLPSPIHLLLPEKPDSSATLPSSSAATSSPPPRPPSHPVSIHMPNSSSLSSSPPVNHSFPPADDSVCSSEASTSLSTDSYDSPPSPPSSLEDQVHVAYAMDDIRLAKILLLKLKGIEVTSDADPRIDEVHDEDFDVCFIPSGPLTIESEDRRAMEDWQRRQKEWGAESQRKKRLKTCEKVWDDEKQRLQSERLAALRLREQQIAAAEAERRRAAQRQHRDQPARDGHQRLSRTSVDKCPFLESRREGDPFQYKFMPPIKSSAAPRQSVWSSGMLAKQAIAQPAGSPRSTVSFKEVLASMNGRLFPLDTLEQVENARRVAGLDSVAYPRHRRRVSARVELLDTLLQAAECHEQTRVAPGMDVAPKQPAHPSRSALSESAPISSSVRSSHSFTSMSSPLSSRSNSWFSFGSWRSSYTDVTLLDAQVVPSPKASKPILLPPIHEVQQDYLTPRSSFVRVPLHESPLSPSPPSVANRHTLHRHRSISPDYGRSPYSSGHLRTSLLHRIGRSVCGMVEVARSIQTVYIAAAVMTAGSSQPARTAPRSTFRRSAHPEGHRVHVRDVKRFTSSESPLSPLVVGEPILYIPLANLAPSAGLPPHRLTTADTPITPSPLRPRTPPTVLAYRMRPVANPALLRLRALQNIMCARGKEWEGRAREGGLGCGKDRVLGVAFEGRGRSGLGCEVRFTIV